MIHPQQLLQAIRSPPQLPERFIIHKIADYGDLAPSDELSERLSIQTIADYADCGPCGRLSERFIVQTIRATAAACWRDTRRRFRTANRILPRLGPNEFGPYGLGPRAIMTCPLATTYGADFVWRLRAHAARRR